MKSCTNTFGIIAIGIVLFAAVLTGCAKEVKTLPPLNKKTAAEECAVLVIPSRAEVKRIDGAKRGLIKSWKGGSKAATLLIPAGEHSIIFECSHSREGWSARNLEYTIEMIAGKMYILSATLDAETRKGTFSTTLNSAASTVRDELIGNIFFWLPRSNPDGIIYHINQIDQETYDKYLLEWADEKHKWYNSLLIWFICGVWFLIIYKLLRKIFYNIFMGKLKNRFPVISFLLALGFVAIGVLFFNYNSSGILSLYLWATLFWGIGFSVIDSGFKSNKLGMLALKGEKPDSEKDYNDTPSMGTLIEDFSEALEADSGQKIKDNNKRAVFHFSKAIEVAPYNADYVNNRGLAYCRLQDWKKAIDDFTQAIQLKPNNAKYINNRGLAYCGLQDWEKATADFTDAVRLSPNNDIYKKNLTETQAQVTMKTTVEDVNLEQSENTEAAREEEKRQQEEKAYEEKKAAGRAAAARKEAAEKTAKEKAVKRRAVFGAVLQLGVTAAFFYLFFSGLIETFLGEPLAQWGLVVLAALAGVPIMVIGVISILSRDDSDSLLALSVLLIILVDIVLSVSLARSFAGGFWGFIGYLLLYLLIFSVSAIPGIVVAAVEDRIVLNVGIFLLLVACYGVHRTTGSFFDFQQNDQGTLTITKYSGKKQVVIPATNKDVNVTVIGGKAFYGKKLASVVIPDGITSIGDSAFYNNKLTGVVIPDSVASIGESAFSSNITKNKSPTGKGNQLTSVTIGNGVTSIGRRAFAANKLTGVDIPDSVASIGAEAFSTNQLTSITVGNSVASIEESAFYRNQLTSVIIPNSVTSIGKGAFASNQLTSVSISNSVTSIGEGAFSGNRLTSVTIPNSVNDIGVGAFANNPVTSVSIGANVKLGSNSDTNGVLGQNTGFNTDYDNGGKRAGTYTRPDAKSTNWTRK